MGGKYFSIVCSQEGNILNWLFQEGKMTNSKNMVQAVTLLTALRMFTNGKLKLI